MLIRAYVPGDAARLRAVFMSAVHGPAADCYSAAQLMAWAPDDYDADQWAARLAANRPFVAEIDGVAAGFADVQADGYIDQFFVAAEYTGRGVAGALMARILAQGLPRLYADVSLRAERFFAAHGFVVEQRQRVEVRGQVLDNARMARRLTAA